VSISSITLNSFCRSRLHLASVPTFISTYVPSSPSTMLLLPPSSTDISIVQRFTDDESLSNAIIDQKSSPIVAIFYVRNGDPIPSETNSMNQGLSLPLRPVLIPYSHVCVISSFHPRRPQRSQFEPHLTFSSSPDRFNLLDPLPQHDCQLYFVLRAT
jgi:hypothetical protein